MDRLFERGPKARLPRARQHTRVYGIVTGITLATLVGGYAVIGHALGAEAGAQSNAAAARTCLIDADTILAYAVRFASAPDNSMTGETSAAMSNAIASWKGAQAAAIASSASIPLNWGDGKRLQELSSQTSAAYQDMLSSSDAILSIIGPLSGTNRPAVSSAVDDFAVKESTYAASVKSEAEYFDDLDARARGQALTETSAFVLLMLGIFGIGVAGVIVPAHRSSARSMELAIRHEEQEARIGSEIARHVAEQDRREAEAQFQALFRHSSIGVALTDQRGWILETNDALARMLGYSEDELRGSQFGEWAIDEPGWSAPPHGRCERLYRRKDGTTFWVDQTSTAAPGNGKAAPATIWMVQDIEERKNSERQLQFDATHDALTGLRNRGYFDEMIDAAVARARGRPNRGFTVFMIDLDRFKYINDTKGHAAGDAVLAAIGLRLRSWATHDTVVARYGGDEFAAFIPDVADATVAHEAASRLQELIDRPLSIHGMSTRLTTSIGVCVWSPAFGDGDGIVRAADSAAYRAKAIGRSRVVAYDTGMAQHDDLRRRIGSDLRTAIEKRQLFLVYQPIVSLPARSCIGFEALVRWAHPELGSVAPSVFVPVAEEVGLMPEVGEWILREACRQLASWQHQYGLEQLKLNVNVSTQQMADARFPRVVEECLQRAEVRADNIVLELTETAMLDWRGHGNDTLSQIRQLGTSIALDDFGTGYSSLSHLQLLPIDALKIDQSFIKGPYEGLSAPAIVHALITLSKTLGISAVAEGVETEKQASLLAHMGCRAAQGFLFSEPLSADAALAFLLNDSNSQAAG